MEACDQVVRDPADGLFGKGIALGCKSINKPMSDIRHKENLVGFVSPNGQLKPE